MMRHYARLDQEQRLFELEREPNTAQAFVRGWTFHIGSPNQREQLVWINPRYIRYHWVEDLQEAPSA